LVWIYVGTFIGFGAVILSMAEMASMAPTAGGQVRYWGVEGFQFFPDEISFKDTPSLQ
jgi:hypothetical protein